MSHTLPSATGKKLGFGDYLKAAFHWQPQVPGLGRMPAHPLALAAFAVLGLANPGFWLLGVAAELAYLFGMASSQRFQKLVRGQQLAASQQSWEERMQQTLDQLGPMGRDRYLRLLAECRQIVGLSEALSEAPQWLTLESHRAGGLNQLLWIFLRLLASRKVLEDNLRRVDRRELEGEIQKLEQRIVKQEKARGESAAESALLRSLRGTLDIQSAVGEGTTVHVTLVVPAEGSHVAFMPDIQQAS